MIGYHQVHNHSVLLLVSLDCADVHVSPVLIAGVVVCAPENDQFILQHIYMFADHNSHQLNFIDRSLELFQVVGILHVLVLLFYVELVNGLVLYPWGVLLILIVLS